MNKRFFSRLSHDSLVTVHRLETGVLRMFLVHASRQARHDVVKDFFEKMSEGLHDRKEWKDWFGELEIHVTMGGWVGGFNGDCMM